VPPHFSTAFCGLELCKLGRTQSMPQWNPHSGIHPRLACSFFRQGDRWRAFANSPLPVRTDRFVCFSRYSLPSCAGALICRLCAANCQKKTIDLPHSLHGSTSIEFRVGPTSAAKSPTKLINATPFVGSIRRTNRCLRLARRRRVRNPMLCTLLNAKGCHRSSGSTTLAAWAAIQALRRLSLKGVSHL